MSRPRSLLEETQQEIQDAAPEVLSRDACQAIARRVLSFATAEETHVSIESRARCDTRFAANQVSTSGADIDTTVSIRSTFGTRTAQLSTNRLDDASLAAAVKEAEALARIAPENPEHVPVLGPQQYREQHPSSGALPSPQARAAAVKVVADRARAAGYTAAGYLEAFSAANAIATSRGLFGYQRTGSATMTATVRTPDGTGSGWAGAAAAEWSDIDPNSIAADATQKASRSRNPVAIEPGRYTVVLEPTAVGNLVQLILYALAARPADEGRSFFSRPGGGNKIGLKVVSDRVTLESDPADAGDILFDADGLPSQKVTWIENGIVKNLAYDRYWAQKQGKSPTPHPGATVRMSGGNETLSSLIASTERGVLVTRFWYIRPVDPRTILYTGLTRDGTFLIENGKITQSIKNMRYNESPIFMLNNLDAMGRAIRVSASEDGSPGASIIVPPIKAHDFLFTSLTDSV